MIAVVAIGVVRLVAGASAHQPVAQASEYCSAYAEEHATTATCGRRAASSAWASASTAHTRPAMRRRTVGLGSSAIADGDSRNTRGEHAPRVGAAGLCGTPRFFTNQSQPWEDQQVPSTGRKCRTSGIYGSCASFSNGGNCTGSDRRMGRPIGVLIRLKMLPSGLMVI